MHYVGGSCMSPYCKFSSDLSNFKISFNLPTYPSICLCRMMFIVESCCRVYTNFKRIQVKEAIHYY